MLKTRQQHGFNLVELMAVVIIIGIISAVAYPSYTNYVERANRSEGQAFLMDIAAKQERYRSQNNAYITSNTGITSMGGKASSETGKYNLTVVEGGSGDGGYLLTASPTFNDSKCGNLILNARGEKKVSSGDKDECWR